MLTKNMKKPLVNYVMSLDAILIHIKNLKLKSRIYRMWKVCFEAHDYCSCNNIVI